MTAQIHQPSGELHVIPTTAADPKGRAVDDSEHQRRMAVRLHLKLREQGVLIPGDHPAEIREVMGRAVIVVTGAAYARTGGNRY
jgi:hypothetical protein